MVGTKSIGTYLAPLVTSKNRLCSA